MAITHEFSQPHEKSASNGNHAPKSMVAYKSGLGASDQYKRGDLCTVDTDGTLKKFTDTVAANAIRLCLADENYIADPTGLVEKPLTKKYTKITHLHGKWVMNLIGTASADPAGQRRNIAYDSGDKVPKVQTGSTAIAVTVQGFDGDAVIGDINAPVIVEFDRSVRF